MIHVWFRFTTLDLHNWANFLMNLIFFFRFFFLFSFFFLSSSFDEMNTHKTTVIWYRPTFKLFFINMYQILRRISHRSSIFLFSSFFFISFDDNWLKVKRTKEYKKANEEESYTHNTVSEFLGKIIKAYIQYKHAHASSPSGEYAFMLKSISYKWAMYILLMCSSTRTRSK